MGKEEKPKAKNVKSADNSSPTAFYRIPTYPFTYVANDSNGNILGSYYVEFKIRILQQKNVEYVVELFPLYSTNVITEFSFTVERTKNNIEKNAKRLFNLNYEGYPGRDGQIFNEEVSKVILGLFNNSSSQKSIVEVETTTSLQPGDSFNSGNATYTIITLPTSTNGTCFLSSVFEESSIVIPSTVSYSGTYTVVSIGNPADTTTPSYNAFANATSYKSVSIPSTVTNISVSAFYGCSNLTTLIIPSGSNLQNIGPSAFQETNLSYIGTSDGGYNSFANCTLLTNISTYAFYDLYLENLIINSTSGCAIGDYAFYNCNYIGTGGLSGFNTLKLGGVVSIGENAFGMSSNNVNAFTSVLLDPSTVSIGTSAFFNCLSITTLTIPTGSQLQSIGDFAFDNNKDGQIQLSYIGTSSSNWNSFQNCSQLSYIGVNAFYNLFLRNLIINSSAFGGCTINSSAFYNCNFIGTGGSDFPAGFNTVQLGGVVSIGVNAFGISSNNVNAYTSVSIDPTTTSIGTSAFFNCLSIATLVIPTGSQLQSIGDSAFSNNKDGDFGLTYVGTSSGNWNGFQNCSQLSYIGQSAFYNSWLQEINLPNNAVNGLSLTIDVSAFYNNNYATTINMGNASVFTLNAGSFDNCTALTAAILTSNASILNWDTAFSDCNRLDTAYINILGTILGSPSSTPGTNILISQANVLKFANFNSSVTGIYNSCQVFNTCGIEYITFNNNIFSTDSNGNNMGTINISDAFYLCGNISNITYNCSAVGNLYNNVYIPVINSLPSNNNLTLEFTGNVTTIQQNAFLNCVGIENTTIPSSVASIGNNAFSGCTSLAVVTVNTYIPNFQSVFQTTPSSTVAGNESITQINFDYVSSNTIPLSACQSFTSLEAITFNTNVFGFDNSAFYGCTSLKEVFIPNYTDSSSIGEYVFNGCTALTYVSIPNISSFNNISNYMFNGCSALTLVNTGSGGFSSLEFVTEFGDGAFSGCAFYSCEMSTNVNNLGTNVFSNCSNLTAVTLSTNSNLTSIPASAFANCIKLSIVENVFTTSSSNSSKITNLQTSAFYGCTNLGKSENIYCSSNLIYVGQYAFSNSGLIYINIPGLPSNSLSGVDEYAFAGCINLTSISIPYLLGINSSGSFVPSILDGVFQNCGFINVDFTNSSGSYFTQGIQSIGNNSFVDCPSLEYINLCNLINTNNPYLINYVSSLGVAAFGNCTNLNAVTLFSTVNNSTATFININNGSNPFSGCISLQDSSKPGNIITDFGINTPSVSQSYGEVSYYFTNNGFYSNIYLPVIYNGNGATSGQAPVQNPEYILQANTVTILGAPNNLVKTGYTFNGWISYFTGEQFQFANNTFTPATFIINEYALLEVSWL